MKKLIVCVVICMAVMCLTLGLGAAAEEYTEGNYVYVINEDGTVTITDYNGGGDKVDVVIPDTLGGRSVSGIGDLAFEWAGLTSVTIPDSVIHVGINPFMGCSRLTAINVSLENDGLAVIDNVLYSKADRRLVTYAETKTDTEYSVPAGVQVIGSEAFFGNCGDLSSVYLPESVIKIEDSAFELCERLVYINIPSGVAEIGANPFKGCMLLKTIDVSPVSEYFEVVDGGVLFSKADHRLVTYLTSKHDEEYVVPEGTEVIGALAFYNASALVSVTLPDTLKEIRYCAFGDCWNMTTINLPAGLKLIDSWAFESCMSLAELDLPEGLETIGDAAFNTCMALSDITIPASVTYVGENPFEYCYKLETLSVSEGNEYLYMADGVLFSRPDARLITYPVTKEESEYTVPEGTVIVGAYAFLDSSVTSVTLADSVRVLGEGAFWDCRTLAELNIPDGLTTVGNELLSGCDDMTELSLPASLTSIGKTAFNGCCDVTVTVQRGSYAAAFCREHCVNYIYPDSMDWLK